MRRLLVVLGGLALCLPGTALGGTVAGTYGVSSTGAPTVADLSQMRAHATWRVEGHPAQGKVDGQLLEAAQGPFVEPCTGQGDGTVSHEITHPGSDTATAFDYSMRMNLLNGTGVVGLRLGQELVGYASETTDRECTGIYAGDNGITLQDTLATGMFPTGTAGDDDWPVRKGADGAWHIDGRQSASEAGLGSSTATAHVTLSGTLRSLRASCKIPTVRDMRRLSSFAQGVAMVRKAGFARPATGAQHIRWAPRGRLYVDELGDAPYALCGRRLSLYRS